MNILVTGGAGFIASNIVDEYLQLGHRVSIIDNLSTGKRETINSHAEFHQADIRDAKSVAEIFRVGRFDLVNHHAAQMDVRRSVADPVEDASINTLGALTLLESCVKHGVSRFVFASSGGAIYGEQDVFPADESHPTRPISPYGVAKLTTEQYLFYYKAVYGMNSVCLRYANVYGPRQNPEGEAGVVAIFTGRMLRKEEPLVNGDGKQTRDYVFVGDVVRANVLALGHVGSGVFNVGTGIETDVNHLFGKLKTLTGFTGPERHAPGKRGEQLRSVLSYDRARKVLGWEPTVDITEGLKRTVEFFRKTRHNAP